MLSANAPNMFHGEDNPPEPPDPQRVRALGIVMYPRSLRRSGEVTLFLGREGGGRFLYALTREGSDVPPLGLRGSLITGGTVGSSYRMFRMPCSHEHASRLREIFPFLRPAVVGLKDSFGFGDRLGIANPAHLRALSGSHMKPVLAQQSIRELERTQRTPDDVLDAASWAAFQEGYVGGFGADADHLKTTDDIDRMARVGFTMYTFDPSAFVVNEASRLALAEVRARARDVETGDLTLAGVLARYCGRTFSLAGEETLEPQEEEIVRAFLKYGGVIAHSVHLFRHLKSRYASLPSEVELSVDETDIPTTPVEHLLVAGELRRLGVVLVSLAPRFVGDFEKGVDFRGDLDMFTREYRRHARIAAMQGPYKLSIHSGSDKFRVYRVIGSLRLGPVHIKTAGTSYLEALRTIAAAEPALLREILTYSRSLYAEERRTYHVSARLDNVPDAGRCTDEELLSLLDDDDARQLFHVTFGKVLTALRPGGTPLFRDRVYAALEGHRDLHDENIIRHFRKHLSPFAYESGERE